MRLSIVIAVLDSHEIVRRQILYLQKLELPESVEIIFVDDGSKPEITNAVPLRNFRLLQTKDFRRWTQGLARMKGIAESTGEYILCTDIDHIVSREAVEAAFEVNCDKMVFPRRFAILDERGNLIRNLPMLLDWGLNPKAIRDEYLSDGVHGNTWLMKRTVFDELGGYDLKRCNSGTHLQGEDREFNKRWAVAQRAGKYRAQESGPPIYFFPMGKYHVNGDENPFGLFHTMKKEKWG